MALLYHLLFFFILLLCNCTAERWGEYCNTGSKIGRNSPVSANIDQFLAEVVNRIHPTGFVATSYGSAPNKIYGLAQCRGDVSKEDCLSCIKDAAKQIRERCPDQADARTWFDYCFLRYNNVDFIGQLDTSYGIIFWNVENVTDPVTFEKTLGDQFDQLKDQALVPKNEGLGKGQIKLSPFITLYGLVQCTRDLSQLLCAQCLATAIGNFDGYCKDKKGCRVLYSSCIIRYELYPFFFPLQASVKPVESLSHAVVHP